MKETAAERLRRSQIVELITRYEGLRLFPSVGPTQCISGHAHLPSRGM